MPTLVLGLGNTIMSDDGVGARAVQELAAARPFPPDVAFVDGGTLGLDLLPLFEGVEKLLVVDAVETGEAPGTLVRLSGAEIPYALEAKVSPHQAGLKDLLAVAALVGSLPAEMVLWGVQPASIAVGTELSPAVLAQLPVLKEKIVQELGRWAGGGCSSRENPHA